MRLLPILTAASLLCATTASAATTYGLYARSKAPETYSNFSIEFSDHDGDREFSLNELTSFSGVTLYEGEDGTPLTLSAITGVPAISGHSDGSEQFWGFASDGSAILTTDDDLDYDLSPLSAEVPVPASALLLLGGLAALGAARRRSRR